MSVKIEIEVPEGLRAPLIDVLKGQTSLVSMKNRWGALRTVEAFKLRDLIFGMLESKTVDFSI